MATTGTGGGEPGERPKSGGGGPVDDEMTIKVFSRVRNLSMSETESKQLLGICPEWAVNIRTVLFTSGEIQAQVKAMAEQICRDYAGKEVLCVGLLSGALIFLADLLRHFTIPYKVDFMVVSSYGASTASSGSIKLKKDLALDPAGAHVLIIEDLIDTGHTLQWIRNHLSTKNCGSIQICCLLDKKDRRTVPVPVDYVGFQCPDEFVIGYGMDYAEKYRCLPFIGVLKSRAYLG